MEFLTGLFHNLTILIFGISMAVIGFNVNDSKDEISSLINLTRQIKAEQSRIREQMIHNQISRTRDIEFFVEEMTKLYDRIEEKKEQNL